MGVSYAPDNPFAPKEARYSPDNPFAEQAPLLTPGARSRTPLADRMTASLRTLAAPSPTAPRDAIARIAAPNTPRASQGAVGDLLQEAVDNPVQTLAMTSPLGLAALPFVVPKMLKTVGGYAGQKAAEMSLPADVRKLAEADPERIHGDEAALNAGMLAAPFVLHSAGKALNTDVSGGMMEAGVKGVHETLADGSVAPERTGPPRSLSLPESIAKRYRLNAIDAAKNAQHAASIEEGAATARVPAETVPPAGFEPTATPARLNGVPRKVPGYSADNPFADLPDSLGKVKPLETEPASAPLQDAADLHAATTPDPELVAGVDALRPKRRVGAPAEDATPEPIASPNPTSPDAFPEGFSMGGALTDNRIPGAGEIPKAAKGIDGLQQNLPVSPEGATPETAALAPEPPAPSAEPVAEGSAPAQGLAPIEGTGETRTRGLSAGVERKAVVNKLTTGLGDLPEYQSVNVADQAARATDLLATDPALARRIALGEAPAPHGLHPESVFVAVENKAIVDGDVATIRDLATGKLTTEATTMGQRIRLLGERDPESPVGAIKKVIEVRMGGAKKVPMATEETVAAIRKQIEGLKVQPDAWAEFVNSLRC